METKEKGGSTPQKAEETEEELKKKLAERDAIVSGKARITREEEQRYNNIGKEILQLRRKLYYVIEMEEKEKTFVPEDYDIIDSIYTRIVNARDDLFRFCERIEGRRGTKATRYILGNARDEIELGISGMEQILYGEVE